MEQTLTYVDAYNELMQIVKDIESGETSVDELSEKIRRAGILIQVCQAKLTQTNEEVEHLLAQLVEKTEEITDAEDLATKSNENSSEEE